MQVILKIKWIVDEKLSSIDREMEKNGSKIESEKKLLEDKNELPPNYRGKVSLLERRFFT